MTTLLTKKLVATLAWNWKNTAVVKTMNKERLLLFGVMTMVFGLSIVLLFARLHNNDRGSRVALPAPEPSVMSHK
jgi:hypothetical protein